MEVHRHVDDRAHVRETEQGPRQRVPQRGEDSRRRHRLVPLVPGFAPVASELRTETVHAQLLARRRGRAEQEEMLGQPVVRRHGLLDPALHARSPGRGDHDRDREEREEHEDRADRHEQEQCHHQPDDPADGREQRHEQVVEREHLIAQHREPVEILGSFVVLDGGDRRLQGRDVRFERDGDLVAETPLRPVEHDLEEPCCRRGCREPEGGDDDAAVVMVVEAVGEELQPQRDQRVGQRHHDRHREREHEPTRLGLVAELHRAPERAQRRGQLVGVR